jgi:hypothetical protein
VVGGALPVPEAHFIEPDSYVLKRFFRLQYYPLKFSDMINMPQR